MTGYKIFSGANGYYVAYERGDGSHGQPGDNGSRLGWDYAAAERELAQAEDDSDDADLDDEPDDMDGDAASALESVGDA